jgi:hypothetical protein
MVNGVLFPVEDLVVVRGTSAVYGGEGLPIGLGCRPEVMVEVCSGVTLRDLIERERERS